MFFAIAALLIHPQIAPQLSFSAEKLALIQPANSVPSMTIPTSENVSATVPDTSTQPDAPTPAPVVSSPAPAFILAKPSKPMTVTVGELLEENRRNQRIWRGLAIASHGAATFDAWSTRRAITTDGAQELNPMLKPFAGNGSLYAAIQVGPLVMDYAARKMMYSRHSWIRHMWWAPQSVSFVSSLFCGAHNLSYH